MLLESFEIIKPIEGNTLEADLSNRDILKGRAEAVLFALGRAVTLNELNIALETDVKEVKKVLSELMDEYENDSRGLVIKCINDTYLLTTKAEYSNSIAKIINTPDKFKFTDAVLEILSVIAYKQPVTRSEIEEIRGVGCGNNLNRLIDYELIEEKGRLDTPGHPIIFGTTDKFLLTFGISNLTELPNISDELIERLNENIENDNVEEDGQLTFGDDISL